MKRIKLTTMALAFSTLFSMVIGSPIEAAVQAVNSMDATTGRNITACVDVCDRSGCHHTCVSAFACSKITEDQTMPITSMKVPKGINCDAFQGFTCHSSFAPIVQVIGGEPSPPMLDYNYNTFYCAPSSLIMDPRVSICVDVCDHVSCQKKLCAQEGECMHPSRDLTRPITSMVVPKGQHCNVYTGLECGGDSIAVLGGTPSPNLLKDYHTYNCFSDQQKDRSVLKTRTTPAIVPRAGSTEDLVLPPICVDACDRLGCHKGICGTPGVCKHATYDLSLPILSITIPQNYLCDMSTGIECQGDEQKIIGGQPSPKMLHEYYSYSCWRNIAATEDGEIAEVEAIATRTDTEQTIIITPTSDGQCENAPKGWIPFARCDHHACITGCMKPGPTCYSPSIFPGNPSDRITDVVVPNGYHCFGFTSDLGCKGTSQEFVGGTPPTIPDQTDLHTFSCMGMGQFPQIPPGPPTLTSRAETTDIPGMIIADSCDAAPKGWFSFKICDSEGCVSGCLDPSTDACGSLEVFSDKPRGPIISLEHAAEGICWAYKDTSCKDDWIPASLGNPKSLLNYKAHSFQCRLQGHGVPPSHTALGPPPTITATCTNPDPIPIQLCDEQGCFDVCATNTCATPEYEGKPRGPNIKTLYAPPGHHCFFFSNSDCTMDCPGGGNCITYNGQIFGDRPPGGGNLYNEYLSYWCGKNDEKPDSIV